MLARPDVQVNLVDGAGQTALAKAARQGHRGIVLALLEHPGIRDPFDWALSSLELEDSWSDSGESRSDVVSSGESTSEDLEEFHDAEEWLEEEGCSI